MQHYSDDLIEMMGKTIRLHQVLGKLEADINWIKCRDLNGLSNAFKHTSNNITSTKKHINMLINNIDLNFTELELTAFKAECEKELKGSMEEHETKIEEEHRPLNLNHNEKALVIMTQTLIPEDIKIGLSFGEKIFISIRNHR